MKRPLIQLSCATAAIWALAAPAGAVPITFAFSGTITRVSDYCGCLDGSIVVGGGFSGYYTFDSTMVDQDADPKVGLYLSPSDPSFVMSVELGSYAISAPIEGIRVEDGKDVYGVGTGEKYFDFLGRPTGMSIHFDDLTGRMVTSDLLPLTPPSIETLPSYLRSFGMGARDVSKLYFGIGGQLERLTLIPEPAGILLMLLAWGMTTPRIVRQANMCRTKQVSS